MQMLDELAHAFRARFGKEARIFQAPGRVNLIGEHTDYNDGFVLPAAIDLWTFAAIAPRDDRTVRAHSLALEPETQFSLDKIQPKRDWSDYVRGVARELLRAGHELKGADILFTGTLPMGAGLSASAALEVSTGYALLATAGAHIDLVALAKLCQRAENEFVGMRCGIMDQFISCNGVDGCALLLDCRSLAARPIAIDPGVRIVIANTMVHHELASSAYNDRRADCEAAVAALSEVIPGVKALRDVSAPQLEAFGGRLPERILRRARHVVHENARVQAAVAALEAGDLSECGRQMNASHVSLRDDYEVSCRELDLMVELAQGVAGVYGARMTGGGFGGCTVSLVDVAEVDHFISSVGPAYESATGLTPIIAACRPGRGVGPVGVEPAGVGPAAG